MTDPSSDDRESGAARPSPARQTIGGLIQIGLIVGVIVAALAFNFILPLNAQAPRRFAAGATDVAVEVFRPSPVATPIVIEETGSVQVRAYVNLSPQVGGRVVEMSPNLAAGGSFEANEVLFRIDPTDYEFALDQARANVLSAQSDLELAQAEAETARREWELVNPGEDIPPLVARAPQITQARAALASAQAVLEDAQTDLARVDYSLPYDGRIVSTTITEGQTLSPNQSYGEAYRLSALEVAAPVSPASLALITPAEGRPATVRLRAGGETIEGEIVRQEAELDTETRFATLIVGFDAPPPLPPGAFVDVTIDGGMAEGVLVLPVAAVGNSNEVWVVENGALQRRTPEIILRADSEVVARAFDIADGVVVTPLLTPSEGFPVRVVNTSTAEMQLSERERTDAAND